MTKKKAPTRRVAAKAPPTEAPSRRMTLAGFQREHDEVERMSIELGARKTLTLTNIRRQITALESLENKVEGIKVE